MTKDTPIAIRVTSEPRYLCVVRAAVEAAADRLGLSEDEAAKLVLAVDEAMTNTIRHGYQGQPGRPIWVTLSPVESDGGDRREGIEVVIEDETTGIDVSQIRPRPRDQSKPGGLGMHIIREAVDEARYEPRGDGPGLRLTLRKYHRDGAARAAAGQSQKRTRHA